MLTVRDALMQQFLSMHDRIITVHVELDLLGWGMTNQHGAISERKYYRLVAKLQRLSMLLDRIVERMNS